MLIIRAKMAQRTSVPMVLDGNFFVIIESKSSGDVEAKCVTCDKIIKGKFAPTSNFTTHLQKHKEVLDEYKKYLLTGRVKRQRKIEFPVVSSVSTEKVRTDGIILNYVVQSMSPLSIVDMDYFKQLVKGLNSNASVPTRKTLTGWIKREFETKKEKLRHELKNVEWVCTTADIWSSRRRSFMGITCHWIDSSYHRHSALLSMKRFMGSHTGDRIAELLLEIFSLYKLDNKITFVVTDNGSNFVKAFRDCQVEAHGSEENFQADIVEDEEMDEDAIQAQDTFAKLDEQSYATLPPHYRCISHTLSLVATNDLTKELESGLSKDKGAAVCKRVMRSAFGKCSGFWNKNGRSSQTAEAVKSVLGKCVIRPVVTRWNSTFDAIELLLEKIELLDAAFEAANVQTVLTAHEKDFLKEYHDAMQPIAWSLDKLQGDAALFFGFTAPVLLKCDQKLDSYCHIDSQYCKFIAMALKSALRRRFERILSLNVETARSEILAAISLPCFKLHWVPMDKKEELKRFFIHEAELWRRKEPQSHVSGCEPSPSMNLEIIDDLFDFDISVQSAGTMDVETECLKYLQSVDTTLESLNNFPTVREMFFKFNTTLPSSAPAERVFSYGGMVLRPQRASLSDETFETLLFLKLNPLL